MPRALGWTEDTGPLTRGCGWPRPLLLAPLQSSLEGTTGPRCEESHRCENREFWRRKGIRKTGKAVAPHLCAEGALPGHSSVGWSPGREHFLPPGAGWLTPTCPRGNREQRCSVLESPLNHLASGPQTPLALRAVGLARGDRLPSWTRAPDSDMSVSQPQVGPVG